MGDPMVWLFLAVAASWVRNVMQDRRIERLERAVEDAHEFAGRAYRLASVHYEDDDGIAIVPRDIFDDADYAEYAEIGESKIEVTAHGNNSFMVNRP